MIVEHKPCLEWQKQDNSGIRLPAGGSSMIQKLRIKFIVSIMLMLT